MHAPRKYDQETRDRAVRMYRERTNSDPAESMMASRKHVGGHPQVGPTQRSVLTLNVRRNTCTAPESSAGVATRITTEALGQGRATKMQSRVGPKGSSIPPRSGMLATPFPALNCLGSLTEAGRWAGSSAPAESASVCRRELGLSNWQMHLLTGLVLTACVLWG
jgi:hypothetical protein